MTVIKKGSFKIRSGLRKLRKQKSTLPKKIGNMAKNHFLDGFRRGGFTNSFRKWEPRRKRISRTQTSDTQKESANLIKSGALRRSISVKVANFKRIKIGTSGIRYANRHNEGLDGMPKREFIGDSRTLEKRMKTRIEKELKTLIR